MRKISLARGGKLSPFSGLGSTHKALEERLASGVVEGYEIADTFEYSITKNPFKRLWRRWFSGPSLVKKMTENCDILHVTDQEQAGLLPDYGKTVLTVHDLFHIFPRVRNGVQIGEKNPSQIRKKDLQKIKQGIIRAKLLICVSKDTQQECNMKFPGTPTVWIPHAIDLDAYQIETSRPKWFEEGTNLLVIGSEEPRKRVDFAIKVCSDMDVTLHKIGAESSPKSKQELCKLAGEINCRLNWVGRLEHKDMVAALQHADALLFPSIAEGFGLPPLEAYAAGTVALVADSPAHNEIPLEHHILKTDDLGAWREAISNLEDETSRVRERAEEFSVKRWAEKHKDAYDSLF